MSKQKIKQELEANLSHEAALRVGAWLMAGLAFVGVTEMITEHQHVVNPATGHNTAIVSELFARGEGKGETARLPEEFDVGLQTPHISGL